MPEEVLLGRCLYKDDFKKKTQNCKVCINLNSLDARPVRPQSKDWRITVDLGSKGTRTAK